VVGLRLRSAGGGGSGDHQRVRRRHQTQRGAGVHGAASSRGQVQLNLADLLAVDAVTSGDQRHGLNLRSRGLRLLQALAAAAEARGYRVEACKNTVRSYQHQEHPPGLLAIFIKGHAISLEMTQQYDRVAHQPTAAERKRTERDSWYRIPSHDRVPTARIEASVLGGGREYRKSRWTDGAVQLEDQLPQILQEVELRAAFMEEQRLEAERERAQRQRQWEEAMARAKKKLRHAHRAEILMRQVDDWTRATHLDRYLDAMEVAVNGIVDEQDQSAARRWLDWARKYRQLLDPVLAENLIRAG
jgi:hypothetical protein